MDKIFILIFLIFFTLSSYSQIVFSEILYDDPGYGQDSLEFIELYNFSNQDIDVTNFSFTDGVTFTFPEYTLKSQSYVVICKYPDVIQSVFDISSENIFAWSETGSIALNNDGEILQFSDDLGNIIDELEFTPTAEWYSAKSAGWGWSIEFCDYNLDNSIGANWSPAEESVNYQYVGNDPFITGMLTTFNINATPGTGCFETVTINKYNNMVFQGSIFVNEQINIPKNSKVFNINGKLIYSSHTPISINTSGLSKGVYILQSPTYISKLIKY